jgi:Fe-S-cluster containining protein
MAISEDSIRFKFPEDVRFECNRCALCCGDTETKTRMILLLKSEAERISRKTLKKINEFAERIEGQEPYVYLMGKTFDGKCVFLEDNLCVVYEMRPLICRFYPFKLDNAGNRNYVFTYTEECPGIGSGPQLKRRFFNTLFTEFMASMGQNHL